jgi:hypothetical protein
VALPSSLNEIGCCRQWARCMGSDLRQGGQRAAPHARIGSSTAQRPPAWWKVGRSRHCGAARSAHSPAPRWWQQLPVMLPGPARSIDAGLA